MRIDRVKLKHFRSHRHTTLALERINFIRGLNKSGKSGLALAVEMALSGRCAVTDEAGKGFEKLIEQGAQTALIALECSDDVVITLTLDRTTGRNFKVQTKGHTILGKQAQEWLVEKIAAPDVINATLNAWRFIRMNEHEQASLLARVLLPEKLELDKDVVTWLEANHLAVIEKPSLFATIEATHKSITMARTEVNRKLRDLKSIVEPEPLTGSRDTVKAKLTEIQTQQAEVNRKITLLSTRAAGAQQQKEQQQRSQLEIDRLAGLVAAFPHLLTAAARKKLEASAKLQARHAEIRALLVTERAEQASIEATIEKLSKHDEQGVCPTCKSLITEESRKAMYAPYMTRLNDAHAAVHRLEKELAEGGDSAGAIAQLAADTTERERQDAVTTSLTNLRQQHSNLFEGPEQQPPDFPETLEALHADLEALKARVVRGLEVLVKIVELEEAQRVYTKQLEERGVAETRLAELEKLLDYFGQNGIKAKLIAERLDLFTERVNAVLAWWGYALAFTIEPYQLRITETDAPHIVLMPSQLSESESYRLGVAFSIAIAMWTGLKFVIADAAEILDKQDKWSFAQGLLASDLDQAILTSTGIAGTFEAQGTAFYTFSKAEGITATELDATTALTTAGA